MSGERVRVMFVLDNMDIGGTEMNAVRTAERLDPARFELHVACLRPDGPLRARYEAAGVPVHAYRVNGLVSRSAARQGVRLGRELRALDVDIVHAHDVYANIFAVPWARLARTPVVIASRRWWTEVNRPQHRIVNRWAYRLAHRVLANSPSVARLLEDHEGVPPRKVVTVPNFVEDEAFAPLPGGEAERTRRELGIGPGDVTLGVVANLRPIKDHATLLRAAARLTSDVPALRLVFIGEGPTRAPLQRQAAELGIARRVSFAGMRAHQPGVHQLFTVSVLCSVGEGFPNSVVEAMAAARPVVATRVGGIVDAVVDGVTGFLFTPGDDLALSELLRRLVGDDALRRRLGEAGQRRARDLYHGSSVVKALEGLYRKLLTERRS